MDDFFFVLRIFIGLEAIRPNSEEFVFIIPCVKKFLKTYFTILVSIDVKFSTGWRTNNPMLLYHNQI